MPPKKRSLPPAPPPPPPAAADAPSPAEGAQPQRGARAKAGGGRPGKTAAAAAPAAGVVSDKASNSSASSKGSAPGKSSAAAKEMGPPAATPLRPPSTPPPSPKAKMTPEGLFGLFQKSAVMNGLNLEDVLKTAGYMSSEDDTSQPATPGKTAPPMRPAKEETPAKKAGAVAAAATSQPKASGTAAEPPAKKLKVSWACDEPPAAMPQANPVEDSQAWDEGEGGEEETLEDDQCVDADAEKMESDHEEQQVTEKEESENEAPARQNVAPEKPPAKRGVVKAAAPAKPKATAPPAKRVFAAALGGAATVGQVNIDEGKQGDETMVFNSVSHPAEYAQFNRQCANPKKMPAELKKELMEDKGKLFDAWMKSGKDWGQCKIMCTSTRSKTVEGKRQGGFVLESALAPYFANDDTLVAKHVEWCKANNMWKKNPNNPDEPKLYLYWVHQEDTIAASESQTDMERLEVSGSVDHETGVHLGQQMFGDAASVVASCPKAAAKIVSGLGSTSKPAAKPKPKAKAKASAEGSGVVDADKPIDVARGLMARLVKERAVVVNLEMQLIDLKFSEQLQTELGEYAATLQEHFLKIKKMTRDGFPDLDAFSELCGSVEHDLTDAEYKCDFAKGIVQKANKAAKKAEAADAGGE